MNETCTKHTVPNTLARSRLKHRMPVRVLLYALVEIVSKMHHKCTVDSAPEQYLTKTHNWSETCQIRAQLSLTEK